MSTAMGEFVRTRSGILARPKMSAVAKRNEIKRLVKVRPMTLTFAYLSWVRVIMNGRGTLLT